MQLRDGLHQGLKSRGPAPGRCPRLGVAAIESAPTTLAFSKTRRFPGPLSETEISAVAARVFVRATSSIRARCLAAALLEPRCRSN